MVSHGVPPRGISGASTWGTPHSVVLCPVHPKAHQITIGGHGTIGGPPRLVTGDAYVCDTSPRLSPRPTGPAPAMPWKGGGGGTPPHPPSGAPSLCPATLLLSP